MTDTHKGIFKGQIKKVRYSVWYGWGSEPSVCKEHDVEWKTISECEFDRPPLKEDEYIYLHQLDKTAQITRVIRSTDNGYLYQTNYVIEEIEDDETLESKKKAEMEKDEIIERLNKEMENAQRENEANKKKWYQFWK